MTAAVRSLCERLVASDPSRGRLRTAAWALLTAAIATALLLALARVFDLPQPVALAGVIVGLVSTVIVQDATPSSQQRTLAAAALVSGLVMVLGAALASTFVGSGAGFLAVTVAGFAVQRFGPRGRALGAMAYQSYFYALLLQPPAALWPWLLAGVGLGCAVAWLVRFRLLPERGPTLLRHELSAFRACILVLLEQVASAVEAPHARRRQQRARATLRRLNDLSLRLDRRLARFTEDGEGAPHASLRDRVLRTEIAAETLQACGAAAGANPRATQAARTALAQALRSVAQAVRDPAAGRAPSVVAEEALDADQRWRFEHAAHALCAEPPWHGALPAMSDATAAAAPPAQPRPAPHASPWRWLADESTRRGLQAGAAALAAMVAGHMLSTKHWYWAVFGALVVFTQAGTRGQALAGAWLRLLGSVAGLALGLLVAQLAHGHPAAQLVLLFVFVAIGFYAFQGLQPAYIALLTAMLAMLYELIGEYSPGLLLLRLEETAIGAAAAVLGALFVLPAHTGEQSDQESVDLLRAAARLLRSAVSGEAARPTDAVRDLDRRLQALRQALGPVTTRIAPTSKDHHRRRLDRVAVLVHALRHFQNLLAGYAGGHRDRLAPPARRLAQDLDAVADALAEGTPMPQLQALPASGLPAATREEGADLLRIALHWLADAHEALRELAQEGAAAGS